MARKKGKGSRWRCIPPPKPNNESEKSRKRKRSKAPGNDLIEHQHNGRAVCTWVPTNQLPVDVLAALEDGIASARRMINLKITQRRLAIPANAHPITYKDFKKDAGPAVTAYFSTVSNNSKNESIRVCSSDFSDDDYECDPPVSKSDTPVSKKKRTDDQCGLRICPYSAFAHDYQWFVNEYGLAKGGKLWAEAPDGNCDDENDCGGDKNQTGSAQSSVEKNQNDGDQTNVDFDAVACRIPDFEEIRIDTTMKQLNLARLAVPSRCKNVDILKGYNVLTKTHG